jgi:hypothetical protein
MDDRVDGLHDPGTRLRHTCEEDSQAHQGSPGREGKDGPPPGLTRVLQACKPAVARLRRVRRLQRRALLES